MLLDMGCSEEWAGWVVRAYKQCHQSGGQVAEGRIFLKEDDGWGLVTKTRDTFVVQLKGGDVDGLLVDAGTFRYTLGFSEEHARELIDELETALEMGVTGHLLKLRFHVSTLEGLVRQLKSQVE